MRWARVPSAILGVLMSALGKRDYLGDFDENGQLVDVPKRPNAAERKAAATRKSAAIPKQVSEQDLARPAVKPPMPAPLERRPVPADLTLDRARDALLTAFGKATLSDRYLMPG